MFTVSFEYDEASRLWDVMVSGATSPNEAVQGFNAVLATMLDAEVQVGMHHRASLEPDARYKISVGLTKMPVYKRN